MEPGEHFSLCWNNFHSNLSSGFQCLYKDEDLVDVTLAAQGHYIKAHKTVLSVCSPFFKDLLKSNPSKHPIIILPDVNYGALRSVVQFMYQGEVSVSQEEISTFMKVAEALKVKGLTDNEDTPNGVPTPPKSASYNTSASTQNFQRRPRPSSSVKKIIRPLNPQLLRNVTSPKPSISPQPNSSYNSIDMPPPTKKQAVDPLAMPDNQVQTEHSFAQSSSDGQSTSGSQHNTPSSSPAPQAVALIKPKEEPLEDGENESHGLETTITIEGSRLLDTQIGDGSVSGSPTHQAASWPSSESMAASPAAVPVEDPSQPDNPGGVLLVKSGKGQLVLIYHGHMYTFCDSRNNQSLWVCVKKKVLNCKGCLVTLNSSVLNSPIVLSCLAHNHPQMHDVIQRLYVPKREGTPITGGVPSTSTSPALNLCNK